MKQDTAGISRVASTATSLTAHHMHRCQRIAIVTGGHRGIGIEIAFAYAEAGAIVYCIDLPQKPDEDWVRAKKYIDSLPELETADGNCKGRLEYVHANVTTKNRWSPWPKISRAKKYLRCLCGDPEKRRLSHVLC